jgi:hypothetical protein
LPERPEDPVKRVEVRKTDLLTAKPQDHDSDYQSTSHYDMDQDTATHRVSITPYIIIV